MSDSIKVAIKVRPLIKRERDDNLPIQWEVQGNGIFSVDPDTRRRGEYAHIFDHIFDMGQNNSDVYDVSVRQIVDAAVNGFNGTIFAYGQTSSGKTHTMMGTSDEPGIIPMAVENMFDAIANTSGREFLLRVSYLEIYNEKVNDLLHKDGTDLKIHEDCNGQVIVKCKEEVTNCPQNVLSIMKKGDKNRRVGETNMNERSSRSHTIFRITIESRVADSDADGAIQVSQLNLVDLAGSERARQTGATGDRFKEGRHINLSLSALGLVIMQLSECQEHINFRDSKLTRILQASLGGNAMTTIICAVTPAALEETQCTLAFASRAKSIKNKPQLNEVMSDAALLKRYSKQIAKLNAELQKAHQVNRNAVVEEMETKLQEQEKHIQLVEARMELLKTRIVSGANSVENVDFKTKSRRRRTWGGPSITGKLNHSLCLPTIQEASIIEDSSATWSKALIKKRQSITQTPVNDIVTEKFQTAVEDFELELIESERNWEMGRFSSDSIDLEDNYYISKRKSSGNHVKFQDDVSVFPVSYCESPPGSPEESRPSTPPQRLEEHDPGTPKEVLRERITHLLDEYTTLQEFTTLEKQLYANEKVEVKDSDDMEALLNHMKKSVTDSETMCLETNKKYSDLQDKYTELESKYNATLQDHVVLTEKVDMLSGIEESLRVVELEKNELKVELAQKLCRLKKLEEEKNDHEFQLDLLESKYKMRVKELESSLQNAWSDSSNTNEKEKLSNISDMQSLIVNLTKELETLKAQSEDTRTSLCDQLSADNKAMIARMEEYEQALGDVEIEKAKLTEELTKLKIELNYKPQGENEKTLTKMALSGLHEKLNDASNEVTTDINSDAVIVNDTSKMTTEFCTPELQCNADEQKDSMMRNEIQVEEMPLANLKTELVLTDDISEFNLEIDPHQIKLKELQLQINEKSDRILELTNLLRIATDENNNVKTDLATFQTECEEQKAEINCLKERLAILVNIELNVTNDYNDVISKLNEVKLEKDSVVDENVKLKLELVQNSEQLKNNENLINCLQVDIDELKLSLEDKNIKLLDMKVKFEELQQIQTQVDSCLEEPITDDKDIKISMLEKELKITANVLQSDLEEIEKFKIEVINLNDMVVKKSNEILDLNKMINELTAQNEQLHSKLETLYYKLDQKAVIGMQNLSNETDPFVVASETTHDATQSEAGNTDSVKMETANDGPMQNLQYETIQNLSYLTIEEQLTNNESSTVIATEEETTSQLIVDAGNDHLASLEIELAKLLTQNKNLLEENSLLRSQIEVLSEQMKLLELANEKIHGIARDLEDSYAKKSILENDLAEQESKLGGLQNEILKLKDQIIAMQSEKTLYEEEKCAMQKIINENMVLVQRIPELEMENEDLKSKTMEQIKELELANEKIHRIEKDLEDSHAKNSILENDLAERESKLGGLDNEIHKLKDQIIAMQSEKTLYEEEKCAMQKIINENMVLVQRIPELEMENEDLKSKTMEQIKELELANEKIHRIEKDLEDSHAKQSILENDLSERESKLGGLQNEIHKLKDQIITMQSEKTLYDGEKCAMQKIINENMVILQRIPKLEAANEDLKLMTAEFEHMNSELRTNLNAKLLELEAIGVQKYESEIQNLKSYVENLEHFNKNIQQENEDLKTQLHNHSFNLESDLDDLRQRIAEQERVTNTLEEDKKNLMERIAELSQGKPDQIVAVKSDTTCMPERIKENDDRKECSSIFTNNSYFDEMDVSLGADLTLEESNGNVTFSGDDATSGNLLSLKQRVQELEESNKRLEITNKEFLTKLRTGESETSSSETVNKIDELMNVKTLLEDENAKLATDLQLKIQESAEIKNDVQALRLGIETLQQTIHLLTTENMEMSNKLTIEKDHSKDTEAAFQVQIDDLYGRISKITEEKVTLESELKICQEHLDILRANSPISTEDEVRQKIERYQEKIDSLTTENIELSTSLIDKIEELDKIKESKALLYEHECSYKDEVQILTQKLESVNQENIELSNNLMEKIEELDSLRQSYELLENKLAVSVQNQLSMSINDSQNEIIDLRAQNNQLKSENIDLLAKVTTLSNENTKFSDNLLETMAELDNSRLHKDHVLVAENHLDKSLHLSRHSDHFSGTENDVTTDDNIQTLKSKVHAYELQVNQLTRLNKKLSDLKLSSCAQCTHLKELNDSRRTLKLEVRSLNHKLQDLQKKFERKCADAEVLRTKASEELNLSVMSDITLNGSISECMNVSFVEERIHSLNNELITLKQSHEKLSNLYKDKCSAIEQLTVSNLLDESISEAESDQPASNNNRARIERVQGDINNLREEIQHLKKRNTTLSESLHKFINEKSHLQTENDTLKVSNDELNVKLKNSEMQIEMGKEKVSILETELTDLNKLVESLRTIEREARNDKLNFEVAIELLETEKVTYQGTVKNLETALKTETDHNVNLQKNLETLMKETEQLKEENNAMLKITKAQTNNCIPERSSTPVKEASEAELQSDHRKLKNELNTAKEYLSNEIKSLKPKLKISDLSNKTVNDLLADFLKIIMVKEQEIIKTVQDRCEQEKQSLEDAKRQSVDAERRVTIWAKELETDIEKLQADLLGQEKQNVKLQQEIERLVNDLKESDYEKQLLKEKMDVLESDFNSLQAELAKQSEVDNKQGKEVNAIQERERLALALAQNREIELQNSIKSMKDQYNKKIEELTCSLEHYKTKNIELRSNLEGIEANERQLKSIIDVKSMDLAKLQQQTTTLETENMQISETCNQLNQENRDKIERINDITNILKLKCDKISEYKTKLESIIPEYEILKDQIKERKQYAEKYKSEYEGFREKTEKELNLIKDKLSDEQIKTITLSEQIMELNNKNKVLLSEIEETKGRCEELEKSNDILMRKVRNSTSNSKVESQIEDLKDQNAMLQKNAEGASNRITSLQESKNLVTKDLISLQGKYDMLVQEKKELENVVASSKAKLNSCQLQLTDLCDKLESSLQEKNKVALELEATKLLVSQKEKEVIVANQEIDGLRVQNTELNEELDELAKEIQDRILANELLRNELFDLKDGIKPISNKVEEIKKENRSTKSIENMPEVDLLVNQNEELRKEVDTLSITADFLRKENTELRAKITELELKLESRSCSSSRSASPLLENNRRKQRRSDLYNQSRPLEDVHCSSNALAVDCRCSSLAQQVRELELQIVSRNGKIATLEMQIQSQNFPYQKKCKDLEENLWAFKNKNTILKEEVKRLQRAMSLSSATECEVCRRRQTTSRDQSTQCLPEHKTFLCGTSSGIVDDFAKIHKLEKEKALMRDLCRSRTREIKELKKQLSEYEAMFSEKSTNEVIIVKEESQRNMCNESTKSLTRDKPQILGENIKRFYPVLLCQLCAMKENISSNILENASAVPSNHVRSIWSYYP